MVVIQGTDFCKVQTNFEGRCLFSQLKNTEEKALGCSDRFLKYAKANWSFLLWIKEI